MKRILVDMSATLIHHGHTRLLSKASEYGSVIVGLTSDLEIETRKLFKPELCYAERREILLAIRYVDEVIKTPWLITQAILDEHRIDLLVHGDDNQNEVDPSKLILLPRTEGISSAILRDRSSESLKSIEQNSVHLTVGQKSLP